MKIMQALKLAAAASTAIVVSVSWATAQDYPKTTIKIIGSTNNSNMYRMLEEPFWKKKVPDLTKGQITADFTSITESGLKGPEIVRMLSTGALHLAHGVFGSVAADDPYFEGLDLAGLATDVPTLQKVSDAYKPVIDRVFREKHDIKLLALLPFPAQAFFCRVPVMTLADLKGKKVRVFSRSIADFVETAGGVSVTIPFVEVVPALQSGVADCAITGTASGNTAKWWEVTSHLYTLSVGGALSFYAANTAAWSKLDPRVRTFLEAEMVKYEKEVWELTKDETQDGINCNTSTGPCKNGVKANMKLAEPPAADHARAKQIANEVVLPRWAKRCGAVCVGEWNQTIGKVLNMTASVN